MECVGMRESWQNVCIVHRRELSNGKRKICITAVKDENKFGKTEANLHFGSNVCVCVYVYVE